MPALGILGALQFLTRIPVRLRSAPDLAACVPWFPVVGAAIGTIVGAAAAGLGHLVPASVAAAVAVMFGVLLTGAFHEDGLADTADALGGWSPAQRRKILEDSRHGSYGVAAMAGSIVVRVLCVASLGPAAAFGGLVAAHTLGRGATVAVMGAARSTPTEGLGADYARDVSFRRAALGVVAGFALATLAVGWWAVPLAVAAGVGALAVDVAAQRSFGVVSGDILGAIEQAAECLVLVVVSGLALRHSVWWAR